MLPALKKGNIAGLAKPKRYEDSRILKPYGTVQKRTADAKVRSGLGDRNVNKLPRFQRKGDDSSTHI